MLFMKIFTVDLKGVKVQKSCGEKRGKMEVGINIRYPVF